MRSGSSVGFQDACHSRCNPNQYGSLHLSVVRFKAIFMAYPSIASCEGSCTITSRSDARCRVRETSRTKCLGVSTQDTLLTSENGRRACMPSLVKYPFALAATKGRQSACEARATTTRSTRTTGSVDPWPLQARAAPANSATRPAMKPITDLFLVV